MHRLWMTIVDWMYTLDVCVSQVTEIDVRIFVTSLTLDISSGTYGGHLELTAFSHLKKRDVKVIQPGLVYVIEWQSGADLSPTRETASETFETQHSEAPIVAPLKDREARRLRREKVRDMKEKTAKSRQHAGDSGDESDDDLPGSGTVYVA